MLRRRFEQTVRAIVEAVLADRGIVMEPAAVGRVARFVLDQHGRMPDYLRTPLLSLTLVFEAWPIATGRGVKGFSGLSLERRKAVVGAWRRSKLGPRRDLIKFYESLGVFGRPAEPASEPCGRSRRESSGFGRFGIRARAGADRGRDRRAGLRAGGEHLERRCWPRRGGRCCWSRRGSTSGWRRRRRSLREEMVRKYRNGGLTVAMGSPKVAYVEGRRVGAGARSTAGCITEFRPRCWRSGARGMPLRRWKRPTCGRFTRRTRRT